MNGLHRGEDRLDQDAGQQGQGDRGERDQAQPLQVAQSGQAPLEAATSGRTWSSVNQAVAAIIV